MTTFDRTVRRILRCTLSLSVLFFLSAATTSASSQLCSNAPSIGPGETLRGEGLNAGEPACFRLLTPTAGLLMLDLAVPGTATVEPRLGLLGPRAARIDVIEQSASHLLVASYAAYELTVCAGTQDPRHALGEFKLRSTFLELDAFGSWKVEQAEADPDPFAGCQKVEQAEADPDPFAGCLQKVEQAEADPDPFSALCRSRDLDDHSDSRFCATAVELGRDIHGEIANGWGDDQDVFVFELAAARTVRIEATGEVDTLGGLYDRRGQRLAVAGDGGENANFRLVKTLQPGVYFVRVEGSAWSNGAYALEIDTIDRSW